VGFHGEEGTARVLARRRWPQDTVNAETSPGRAAGGARRHDRRSASRRGGRHEIPFADGRSRGLIVVEPSASGTLQIAIPVDLTDSEIHVQTTCLDLDHGSTLRDMTFTVAEGATLFLVGTFDVAGTLGGTSDRTPRLVGSTELRTTADVRFDEGGTGLVASPGSGNQNRFTSAGGAFTNTGLLRVEGSGDGSGRFENASLLWVRTEDGQASSRSRLGGALRSLDGSELRVSDGAVVDLDAPGSVSLVAGTRLTGSGQVYLPRDLFLEGTVSPGTDAAPFDTLTTGAWTLFSRASWAPRRPASTRSPRPRRRRVRYVRSRRHGRGLGRGPRRRRRGPHGRATLLTPAPNPARGPVALRWGLPTAGRAALRVFDLLGREVAVLAPSSDIAAGWQRTDWTPDLASGVYVVRLDAEVGGRAEVRTRRLVVLR